MSLTSPANTQAGSFRQTGVLYSFSYTWRSMEKTEISGKAALLLCKEKVSCWTALPQWKRRWSWPQMWLSNATPLPGHSSPIATPIERSAAKTGPLSLGKSTADKAYIGEVMLHSQSNMVIIIPAFARLSTN